MWWPYLILLLLLFGLLLASQRRRRRQMAEDMVRIGQIGFGTEVMTTSGLYGTVTGKNDDGTVMLAIAPGVEVKWALAALRDAKSLPQQYRRGIEPEGGGADSDPDQGAGAGPDPDPDEPDRR